MALGGRDQRGGQALRPHAGTPERGDRARAARLDREQMAAELDSFVAALDRDLIDATDFAR
jgi:hypothetical protein